MKSNGLTFPSFLFFTIFLGGKRGKYIKVSFKRKCSLAKEEELLFWTFLGPKRELLNLDSGVSDKQVEEVVQLLLSLQFAFNFLTKKFVSWCVVTEARSVEGAMNFKIKKNIIFFNISFYPIALFETKIPNNSSLCVLRRRILRFII